MNCIGYEEDNSKLTITMEINQEKNCEDIWNSKISVNGKWEIEGMRFGQDTPSPTPFTDEQMGP